jgi:hypothetical protein
MNDKYNDIMKLILDYGHVKMNIGLELRSDHFSAEKVNTLDNEKKAILDQICDAIIKLTK